MENKVLATVSGRDITENDLKAIIMRYPEDKRGFFNSEAGKKQLLEQMIAFELMNNLGLELGINNTEAYKESLKSIEKDLLTQMTMNKVLSEVTVTEDDAKKYYEENSNEFNKPETVEAKHILVDNEELCSKIKEEINNGEISFEDAAKKYSSCPSKAQGGSLGAFSRGMMVPEFEEVAFTSEMGKVTEPVKTQFGYHLIKVEGKNQPTTIEFNEVKDRLIGKLIQDAQQGKYFEVLKELEEKYGVSRA